MGSAVEDPKHAGHIAFRDSLPGIEGKVSVAALVAGETAARFTPYLRNALHWAASRNKRAGPLAILVATLRSLPGSTDLPIIVHVATSTHVYSASRGGCDCVLVSCSGTMMPTWKARSTLYELKMDGERGTVLSFLIHTNHANTLGYRHLHSACQNKQQENEKPTRQ
jgi:ankyrin repeat protein